MYFRDGNSVGGEGRRGALRRIWFFPMSKVPTSSEKLPESARAADGSADIVNAMTVDVEDYFHVSAFAKVIDPEDWGSYECRVENNTEKLLNLLALHETRATFFVLGWVARHYPGVVRRIAEAGHEIACHGLTHRLVYEQSPNEFHDETRTAKQLLEDIIQQPVNGYRAASYSITAKSLWAIDILAELGFLYDSSIFPIRHDRYGIPGAARKPHLLHTTAGTDLLEFPLSTKDLGLLRLPVSGGGYFRLLPYAVTRTALASINRQEKMPFIFYLHPWEIDPGQPRIKASWLSRFRHYNNLEKCELMLDRLLGEFRFGTVRESLAACGLWPDDRASQGGTMISAPEVRRAGE